MAILDEIVESITGAMSSRSARVKLASSPTLVDFPKDSFEPSDVLNLRKSIYDKALNAFKTMPEQVYGEYALRIEDPDYDDPEEYSIHDERMAIITGRSLDRRIRGDVVLYNKNTGQEIGRRRITLARVPYLTSSGTFIINGSSYALINQLRLKPGIYVRIKENNEVDAFINSETGNTHHYTLDPQSGVFYLKYGQANIPLITVLKTMGVPDTELEKYWGKELLLKNLPKAKDSSLLRLFRGVKDQREIQPKLQQFIQSTVLDPYVVNSTIGIPADRPTPDVILRTTSKMLKVFNREIDPDERDALKYQKLVGPDDLIAESFVRANMGVRKFIPRVVRKNYDLSLFPSNYYSIGVNSLVYGSGLSELLEEINPTEIIDRLHRVTKMGPGGVENIDAVTMEMRSLHPTQAGYIDPVVTGKLKKVGTDNRLSWLMRRGKDGRIYTMYKDTRSGKFVWRAPEDVADAVVAYPGELSKQSKYVVAIKNGKTAWAKREHVDYELPYPEQLFSPVTLFVSAVGAGHPQRVLMGEQMHLQGLPLVHGEAPLVQTKYPFSDKSFHQEYGKFLGARFAPVDGVVEKVTQDKIVINTDKGERKIVELYNLYPFNRKTFLHNTPVVSPGDRVKRGQILARSNYTDNTGTINSGINAYVAFVPYHGYTYEDAIVVSESFAKKLLSEHMYQEVLDLTDDIIIGKDKYKAIFPGKYPEEFYEKYDNSGMLKPGQTVKYGEPLILAVRKLDFATRALKKDYYADASLLWEHTNDGTVVDTYKSPRFLYINAKSTASTIVGDKLSGRYGDKGVISRIVPDSEMPVDSNGRRFDVLYSPYGLISRGNPNQIFEVLLGKIAKETGKSYYLLPSFHENFYNYVDNELKSHKIQPTDTIYDPKLNLHIPNVLTGYKWIMKLHHMAESKMQERGESGEYTSEGTPAKGGTEGAKMIGMMELMALLAHGAYETIRDARFVRGKKSEKYWLDFMRGASPKVDTKTFVYDKFINLLRGAGINVANLNNELHLFGLTNKDINELTVGRELQNADTIKITANEEKPVSGGLFDPNLTGGLNGTFWSYIKLSEPMPNPIMEDIIKILLDITDEQYRDIIAGVKNAPISEKPGVLGLKEALGALNIQAEIQKAIRQYNLASLSVKNKLIKKLRVLRALEKSRISPQEWIWDKLPVIPPVFRPISAALGTLIIADVNSLYQDAFEANEILKDQKQYTDDLRDERLALYDAMRAVVGIGEPIKTQSKRLELRGLLDQIIGKRMKWSFVQRKLLGTTTDLTGRAVIVPNVNLDIDHIGLPIEQAWVLFRPFIIRKLVRKGIPLGKAVLEYKKQTDLAKRTLQEVADEMVILVNRAPTLHRYGIMAFHPVLIDGKVLEIPPQVTEGFGADFDGDAVQIHVPSTPEAQREAREKMLPSKRLFGAAYFNVQYTPRHDFLHGLWLAANRRTAKKPRIFRTPDEVENAVLRGEVDVGDPVIVQYSRS